MHTVILVTLVTMVIDVSLSVLLAVLVVHRKVERAVRVHLATMGLSVSYLVGAIVLNSAPN